MSEIGVAEIVGLPEFPEAIRKAVIAERDAGQAIVVSGFGENGSGGLGILYEDCFAFVDRRATWGVGSDNDVFLRLTSQISTSAINDDTAGFVSLEIVHTSRSRRTVSFESAPRLHDVICTDGDIYLTTGNSGQVFRSSIAALSSTQDVVCDEAIVGIASFHDQGQAAVGLALANEKIFVTVTAPKGDATGGGLVDLSTGEQTVRGFDYPTAAVRWDQCWLICDLAANAVVMVHDNGERRSIALGGVVRGVLVHGASAFVLVGRPAVLRTAADREMYRLVALDLSTGGVVGQLVLPLARLIAIKRVPVELVPRLLQRDAGNQSRPPSMA